MKTQEAPMDQQTVYDDGERHYFPQIFSVGGEVANFWSTVFLGAAVRQDEYEQLVETALDRTGVLYHRERVSFGRGVIRGIARRFYTLRRGSVIGTVYIGRLGEDLTDIYVSLRVLFVGAVSAGKTIVMCSILTFVAALASVFAFIPAWVHAGLMKNTYDCSYGTCYVTSQEVDKLGGLYSYLGTLLAITCIFLVVFYLWSWWRYGDAQALLREDLDELHRDDLSALGHELYIALNVSADELDFKRLTEEPQAPPAFGATTQTNRTRKRRI